MIREKGGGRETVRKERVREGGRKGGRKRRYEGVREGGREGWREGRRKGRREEEGEGRREGGREGARESLQLFGFIGMWRLEQSSSNYPFSLKKSTVSVRLFFTKRPDNTSSLQIIPDCCCEINPWSAALAAGLCASEALAAPAEVLAAAAAF